MNEKWWRLVDADFFPDPVADVSIRRTLYALATNMVDAINKEADKENKLKIDLMRSFE